MKKRAHESISLHRTAQRFYKAMAAFIPPLILLLLFGRANAAQSKAPKPGAAKSRAVKTKATKPEKSPSPDLTKQPTLYVVGYAHLDTQWRWEYPQVIREYLTKTMRDNFALFEKYPHYVFNFSGANRYRMMKEYYPADSARLKQYVVAGRWFPAGSSMEEGDVNAPSAEAIIRQILYGNNWFRREFGKASVEYMLPDCFGFPSSLPSILAHSGVKGFSTQKLTWGSAAPVGGPDSPEQTPQGIPFNVGLWEGPDGKTVIAALNPGDYNRNVNEDLSKSPAVSDPKARNAPVDWPKRVRLNGEVSGLFSDYHYYGVGDTGGSPGEPSVRLVEAIVTKGKTVMLPPLVSGQSGQQSPPPTATQVRVGDGPLRIVSAGANQMFLDIKPSQVARLPRYKGELELTNHSAGSLTSQAYQKRWNRQNELLADAAEKASVAAEWLGGRPYPRERLNDAWTLVMGGHFHDILAGTATPKSYEYSWNDDVVAMNQFAGVLTSATAAISSGLNTQAKGTAIVVYNPLNVPREDVVEATISISSGAPWAIRVTGPDGTEVPAQLIGGTEGSAKVLFLARVPSVGYAIYDVQSAESSAAQSALRVTESSLENARYRVNVDQNGDVTSIFDKTLDKELLSAPTRLAFQTEKPHDWPAWNMDWADQQKPPRAYAQGPAKIRIVEKGPVRVALEVKREAEGSKFVQTIRLAAGDAGNRVEFANVIDWKTSEAALKATFPLAASNPWATYNWDVGTIERGNNDERKFEVASHQWVDLTDKSGAYGVTVLTDCKNASDKPNDNTLRLTLIYTPGLGEGNGRDYSDQVTQDWGHHEFVYGLAGHAGDWRQAETDWQAYRLNQPLMAFESPRHPGALGKNFSLLSLNNTRVRILALKKAEESDEVIVRIVEIDGKPTQNIRLKFAAPVIAAREVNGQEMPMGPARVDNGELTTSLTPYELRTFALRLGAAPTKVAAPQWRPVALPYDQSVATQHGRPAEGNFDNLGRALPAEMLPTKIDFAGIRFALASAGTGKPNAVVPRGQTIGLPSGKFSRLYVLTASAHGDQNATFRIGDKPVELTIEDWTGYIGQWDNRSWNIRQEQVPERALPPSIPPALATQMRQPRTRTVMQFAGHITPGFIKRASLAWFASHRHAPDGTNEPYAYSYLFAYPIDIPAGARTLTLPENANIRVLAVTVANESGLVRPAHPLYDTLEPNER